MNHPQHPDRVGESSQIAVKGCISKWELCNALRPGLSRTRSYVLKTFFTPERIKACGLTPEVLFSQQVRVFSPDASAFIIDELKRLKFL